MTYSSKLCLSICELFHPRINSFTIVNDRMICSYYIIHTIVSLEEFKYLSFHQIVLNLLQYYFFFRRESVIIRPIVRNYFSIINNLHHIKLEIIEVIIMENGEKTACIKTIWLKLFQRRWKRICYERKTKIQKLKNPYILHKREICGFI